MTDVATFPTASARAAPLGPADLLRGVRRRDAPAGARRGSAAGRTRSALGRPHGWSVRRLTALAALLVALFVVAPPTLAGGTYGGGASSSDALAAATRGSLVDLWRSGTGELPPSLRSAVDYWARYHAAKALLAALSTAVLVVLALRLWDTVARRAPTAGRGARVALPVVALLALGAGLLTMANVQGAVAPLFSLVALADPAGHGGAAAQTAAQARELLAAPAAARGSAHAEPLRTVVDGFADYHVVLALLAAVASAGLAVLGVRALRARRSLDAAASRRTLRRLGVAAIGAGLLLAVVALANVSNAAAPEQGLAVFLGGG